jgi:hypothetical protein
MVVGADQTLVRDNLASAEVPEIAAIVAEADNGILDAALVDAVDVFGSEFETGFLHVGIVLADKVEKPHTFVCTRDAGEGNEQCECNNCFGKEFLHFYILLVISKFYLTHNSQ